MRNMASYTAERPASTTVSADGTNTSSHTAARPPRLRGFDGLRAIAAMAVLVYHLIPGWAPAGFAGVDMFFVLSGFLITALLLQQLHRHGRLELKSFWLRRFRRLVPAVVVTLIGASALALAVGGDALVSLPRQFVGALTGTYNWVEIANGASYFEQNSPLLFTNMWSLSVEQQFYVFWPLIVALLVFWSRSRRLAVVFAVAATSIVAHVWLSGVDLSRAYMGTDTHLWGLMLGAGIALAIPGALKMPINPTRYPTLWGVGGWLGLLAAITMMMVLPESLMYPWGMVAISVAVAITVRSLLNDVAPSQPALALTAILENPVLVWLGVRSYGIYLWHWPLWVLMYYLSPTMNPLLAALPVIVLSIVFAELSYRFIETPIRTHGFLTWCRQLVAQITQLMPVAKVATIAGLAGVLIAAGSAIAVSPQQSSAERALQQAAGDQDRLVIGSESDDEAQDEPGQQPSEQPSEQPAEDPSAAPSDSATETAEDTATEHASPVGHPGPEVTGENITMIGDSLLVAAGKTLNQDFPGIYLDAEISRSIQSAPEILNRLKSEGKLRPYVVVGLATNAVISQDQIETIREIIGPDRRLVLVTGYGPSRATWIDPANRAIREAVKNHDDIYLADWNNAIQDHLDLLADDSVHPKDQQGRALYSQTIEKALARAQSGEPQVS